MSLDHRGNTQPAIDQEEHTHINGIGGKKVFNIDSSGNVVNFTTISVSSDDSPSIDAFGRWRISQPHTLFDSKQLHDNQPLFWDDSETSGSGTSSSHSINESATTLSVGATTAGTRVRQTFQRFNYQPGKSQLIFCTFSEFDTSTGIFKAVGYYDGNDGLFFESDNGTIGLTQRSSVTGSVVDTTVTQSNWNIDKMDGTGSSGISLDFSKSQIGLIDFEWLGVGRVRMGFVVDGIIHYAHQFLNANNLSTVYMSSPNRPIRYEISNDGSGSADDFVHICSTVISEGGISDTGILRAASTGGAHIDANTADTVYAVIGLRLKSTHLDAVIREVSMTMISETNDDFEWLLYLNPTVAGTFTYDDVTNSCVQRSLGATANTITGGILINSGFAKQSSTVSSIIPNALSIGSAIDGTRDELVLAVRPLALNADIQASITWRELS